MNKNGLLLGVAATVVAAQLDPDYKSRSTVIEKVFVEDIINWDERCKHEFNDCMKDDDCATILQEELGEYADSEFCDENSKCVKLARCGFDLQRGLDKFGECKYGARHILYKEIIRDTFIDGHMEDCMNEEEYCRDLVHCMVTDQIGVTKMEIPEMCEREWDQCMDKRRCYDNTIGAIMDGNFDHQKGFECDGDLKCEILLECFAQANFRDDCQDDVDDCTIDDTCNKLVFLGEFEKVPIREMPQGCGANAECTKLYACQLKDPEAEDDSEEVLVSDDSWEPELQNDDGSAVEDLDEHLEQQLERRDMDLEELQDRAEKVFEVVSDQKVKNLISEKSEVDTPQERYVLGMQMISTVLDEMPNEAFLAVTTNAMQKRAGSRRLVLETMEPIRQHLASIPLERRRKAWWEYLIEGLATVAEIALEIFGEDSSSSD